MGKPLRSGPRGRDADVGGVAAQRVRGAGEGGPAQRNQSYRYIAGFFPFPSTNRHRLC